MTIFCEHSLYGRSSSSWGSCGQTTAGTKLLLSAANIARWLGHRIHIRHLDLPSCRMTQQSLNISAQLLINIYMSHFTVPIMVKAESEKAPPAFGFVGVRRSDVLGEHPQPLLAFIMQPQIQFPPRLELLRSFTLEVPLTVTHPQLIWILRETLQEVKQKVFLQVCMTQLDSEGLRNLNTTWTSSDAHSNSR